MTADAPHATLTLSPGAVAAVRRHALQALPHEACGLLFGRTGDPGRVVETRAGRNAAADPRASWVLDPAELAAGLSAARRCGLALVGFYHSHPGGVASPSARDEAAAWPGVSYLVVGVGPSGESVLRSFRRESVGALREEALELEGPHRPARRPRPDECRAERPKR